MNKEGPVEIHACKVARGFTLVELLVAVSILALLLTFATPNFSSWLLRAQLNTNTQKIHSLLALARQKSVSSGQRVVICRWDGLQACTGRSASHTLAWTQGALLFYDLDQDRTLDAPEEEVIQVIAFEPNSAVTWNRGETLVYEADGSVLGGSNGTFRLSAGDLEKTLVISLTGRVRRAE